MTEVVVFGAGAPGYGAQHGQYRSGQGTCHPLEDDIYCEKNNMSGRPAIFSCTDAMFHVSCDSNKTIEGKIHSAPPQEIGEIFLKKHVNSIYCLVAFGFVFFQKKGGFFIKNFIKNSQPNE